MSYAVQANLLGGQPSHFCLRCSRHLTNPVSISYGKGPVCRHKSGFIGRHEYGERYDFKGLWQFDSHCLVNLYYNDLTGKHVFILTEPPDNEGTSVTNWVEHIAADLLTQYGFDPSNTVIIEHYPIRGTFSQFPEVWSVVEPDFIHKPDGTWKGSTRRDGRHMWRHVEAAEVNRIVGLSIADESENEGDYPDAMGWFTEDELGVPLQETLPE